MDQARAATEANDFETAVLIIRETADPGDTEAQRLPGNCYSAGLGVGQNAEEAVKYYRLAADQGLDAAQYKLGVLYQSVVLCEKLTLREKPDASSKVVLTLDYGDLPIVMEQENGWAYCAVDDTVDALLGWVNVDYLAVDPAWYRTESKTAVYAWNDAAAPKVALLDANTRLPILKEAGDWLVVSLRGATGWIVTAQGRYGGTPPPPPSAGLPPRREASPLGLSGEAISKSLP